MIAVFIDRTHATISRADHAARNRGFEAAAAATAAVEKVSLPPLQLTTIRRNLMHDHLCSNLIRGCIISAKLGTLTLSTLGSILEEPASKRLKTSFVDQACDKLDIDIDVECGGEDVSEPVTFFQVTWLNLGKKKTVPVAPGAGRKIGDAEACVHVFSNISQSTDGIVVCASVQSIGEPEFVLSGLDPKVSLDVLVSDTQAWETTGRWIPHRPNHLFGTQKSVVAVILKNARQGARNSEQHVWETCTRRGRIQVSRKRAKLMGSWHCFLPLALVRLAARFSCPALPLAALGSCPWR